MVPDKIYISPNIENRTWLIGKADTINIEYIRKDALLEWAEAKKSELFNGEPTDVAAGINAGLDMIINKLKSV